MKVTVIIPTIQKTEAYLRRCVESLRAAEVSKDWDIIVVSNGGPHYPLPGLQARRLHITNQGQCIAVNVGARALNPGTTHIMVSNDDMYYAPDWAKNLRFDHKVFSPNLVEPVEVGSAPPFLKFDGGQELATFDQQEVDSFVKVEVAVNAGEETTGFNLPFFCEVGVWQTVGGYDESYDPWGSNSDTDLQTLFEVAGIQPMRLRDVLVYHFGSKSGTFDPERQSFWQKNFDYYRTKFGYTRDDEPQADTWMATGMVIPEKLIFHPEWKGKYSE